jgi:hypothetical protein
LDRRDFFSDFFRVFATRLRLGGCLGLMEERRMELQRLRQRVVLLCCQQ